RSDLLAPLALDAAGARAPALLEHELRVERDDRLDLFLRGAVDEQPQGEDTDHTDDEEPGQVVVPGVVDVARVREHLTDGLPVPEGVEADGQREGTEDARVVQAAASVLAVDDGARDRGPGPVSERREDRTDGERLDEDARSVRVADAEEERLEGRETHASRGAEDKAVHPEAVRAATQEPQDGEDLDGLFDGRDR